MAFLSDCFEHLRHLATAARAHEISGSFELGTMNATLRSAEREVRFQPQFLVRNPHGGLTYGIDFTPEAEGFIGWLPYFNKRWAEAYDKLAFKKRCASLGLPTPAWSAERIDPVLGDFVIKAARGSSFGRGVRGPFRADEAAAVNLQPGEYADQFLPGQIGKAWYWGDRVVAIELDEPARVVGDGTATLAGLVRRVRFSADVEAMTDFFRYRGLDWQQVPADGEAVVIDFKYGSSFGPIRSTSNNRLAELANGPVVAQLNAWGPLFWGFSAQGNPRPALYTVDFVVSTSAGIRLLEMNCNPMVPPEAYDVILRSAFDPALPPYELPFAPPRVVDASPTIDVPSAPAAAKVPPPAPVVPPMGWAS